MGFRALQTAACAGFLLSAPAARGQAARSYVEISEDTSFVDCYKQPRGSRLARGATLVSPDGQSRAYAEVEAVLTKNECINNSRLFVATSQDGPYTLVYLEEPTLWQLGNAMKLIDWSPDGNRLLVELFLFQRASDFGGRALLLYDVQDGYFTQPKVYEAFSTYFGRDCSAPLLETLGFSQDGRIVFKAGPSYNESGELEDDTCLRRQGLWLLDPANDTVESLPDNYRPLRFGKIEKSRPKN